MPYSNVPKELWDKMDRCVERVMKDQNLSKKRAIAICHAELVKGQALALSMAITKVQTMADGRVRWRGRANTGKFDQQQERFDTTFWDDVLWNFGRQQEALSRGIAPPDGMATPQLDISHYSFMLPEKYRSRARAGYPSKLWRDGMALMAQGYFDDTPLGRAAAEATLRRAPENRRLSIGVWPDWFTVEQLADGRRVFKGGRKQAYLDHLAMTAFPVDPGTSIELEVAKAMTTIQDDALTVLGEENKGLVEELERLRDPAAQKAKGAVAKTEEETPTEMEEETPVTTEEEVSDTTEETSISPEEEHTDEPAEKTEATETKTKEVVSPPTEKALPITEDRLETVVTQIVDAILTRLEPVETELKAVKSTLTALASDEGEKIKAALDSPSGDGDWLTGLMQRSTQRGKTTVKGGVDDTSGEDTPEEDQGVYGAYFGG